MKVIFPVMGAENISVAYLSSVLKKAGHTVKVAFDRALFDDKQYFSVPFLARIFSEKEKMMSYSRNCSERNLRSIAPFSA